jgi:DUF4097 and DUF4098 domain-containing protein YvlB
MRETFATAGPVILEIRIPDGDIDIQTEAGEETFVELTGLPEEDLLQIARIDLRERGGTYEVLVEVEDRDWAHRFFKRRRLRLDARAPDGTEVRVRTGSADTRGRGSFGTLSVESGSGDVDFEDVGGDTAIKSGSGDIRLRTVTGDAAVSTGSGDVDIDRVGGGAHVRSASGDVHIGEAGADVTVQTASGDQQVDAVAEGLVTLQSASGDMTVGVRRGSRLAVDARSMSGDTSSEIDLEVDEAEYLGEEGPLVELRATAMSGDIRVVRA